MISVGQYWKSHWREWSPLLLVLTLSLLATTAAWQGAVELIASRNHARFDQMANQTLNRLQDRVRQCELGLTAVRGLFVNGLSVERHEWRAFLQTMHVADNYPGIRDIYYLQAVPPKDLVSYVRATQADHAPHYEVWWPEDQEESSKPDVYCFIKYSSLPETQAVTSGLECGAIPEIRQAMNLARDRNRFVLTTRIRQPALTEEQGDILAFMPVYRPGLPVATLPPRRAALCGWIGAALRVQTLLLSTAQPGEKDMGLDFFQGEACNRNALVFHNDCAGEEDDTTSNSAYPHLYWAYLTTELGDRPWTLRVHSTAAFAARQDHATPLIVLLLGLALSACLLGITWSLVRQRAQAHALAMTKAASLTQAKHLLREEHAGRRQTEETLLTTQFSIDYAADPIFWLSPQGRFLYVNQATCRILGLDREKLLRQSILDFGGSIDRQAWEKYLAELMVRGELCMEFPDWGTPQRHLPIEICSVYREFNGRAYIFAVARDLSARQQAQEALRASQKFLDQTIDALAAHLAIMDARGNIVAVNQAWREFGKDNGLADSNGCVGQNYLQVCARAVAAGDQECIRLIQGLQSVLDASKPEYVQEYTCHSPIRQRWFQVRFTRFEHRGQLWVVAAHENISHRRLAEEASQQAAAALALIATALEQTTDGVVVTDATGRITYVNPAFEKMTGYPAAELLGQNPRLLKSGHQDNAFYQNLWTTILSGAVWCGYFINRRKDGTLYEESSTITPVRDATGRIANFVAMKRQINRKTGRENPSAPGAAAGRREPAHGRRHRPAANPSSAPTPRPVRAAQETPPLQPTGRILCIYAFPI